MESEEQEKKRLLWVYDFLATRPDLLQERTLSVLQRMWDEKIACKFSFWRRETFVAVANAADALKIPDSYRNKGIRFLDGFLIELKNAVNRYLKLKRSEIAPGDKIIYVQSRRGREKREEATVVGIDKRYLLKIRLLNNGKIKDVALDSVEKFLPVER